MVSDVRSAGSCTDKFITASFIGLFFIPPFCGADGLSAEDKLVSTMWNFLQLESSRAFLEDFFQPRGSYFYQTALTISGFNDYLMTPLFQTEKSEV